MGEEQVACVRCGAVADADEARVTWALGVEGGVRAWTCPACTREVTRALEARLDPRWW